MVLRLSMDMSINAAQFTLLQLRVLQQRIYAIEGVPQAIEQLRDALDRVSGGIELKQAQEQLKIAQHKFDENRKSLLEISHSHQLAGAKLLECTKKINETLERGGLTNENNLTMFARLARDRIHLESEERTLKLERTKLLELEKETWLMFAESVRSSYSKEQTYKEKMQLITLYASAAGFLLSFVLYEPIKLRTLEKSVGSVVQEHVERIQKKKIPEEPLQLVTASKEEYKRLDAAEVNQLINTVKGEVAVTSQAVAELPFVIANVNANLVAENQETLELLATSTRNLEQSLHTVTDTLSPLVAAYDNQTKVYQTITTIGGAITCVCIALIAFTFRPK
eukprot:c5794_g1_i1.p1 GENE.c5794_g1_i1~~c5794_g1_i1.p1  ORF type:complete len:338 (-),score=100.26 c5794_g1_i1:20-1033(-)